MIIAILGRQPHLGLAEFESLYGPEKIQPLGEQAALINTSRIDQNRLGGAIKIAKIITTLPTTNWQNIADFCLDHFPIHTTHHDEGKITLGLSAYSLRVTPKQLQQTAFSLKKAIRSHGRSIRIVPNQQPALSSAQVLHNHLAKKHGVELIFVGHAGQTYIAQTLSIQDIESYTARDFNRPKRNAANGMLPPKLAQTMLNLANPHPQTTVLDPFCGTGVVLMEAALQNFPIAGSDLNQRMISHTQTNLQWLAKIYQIQPKIAFITQADATTHQWPSALQSVVCETYLGRPLITLPNAKTLSTIITECDVIIRKFLINLRPQLASDARCCIAVPAWRSGSSFHHLPVVDDLRKIGYNRISFSLATNAQLIYHRPGQIVARELLVLTPRKN